MAEVKPCPRCNGLMSYVRCNNNPRMAEYYCPSCHFSVLPTGEPSNRQQYETTIKK